MQRRPPQLDFEFTDARPEDPPVDENCFFEVSLASHPRLPLTVRRETFRRGVHAGPHRHVDFYALYIIRGGQGIHMIDSTPYAISRGDVYLLAPGSIHGYLDYRDLLIDAIYFPVSLLETHEIEALRELSGFWHLFMNGGEKNVGRRLHLSPTQHTQIEAQIEELRGEYSLNSAASEYMLRSGFFRLLINLARQHKGEKNEQLSHERAPFGRALNLASVRRWCEENRGETPTIRQMAAMMALSPSHFRAVWKKETGTSPTEYLRRIRLERAREALGDKEISIGTIARANGFSDSAHFSRSFAAVYGQSPRAYRQSRISH
jgi:AraC-like DNA-binding protein/quercetin dioxygenase-like cupin family protein